MKARVNAIFPLSSGDLCGCLSSLTQDLDIWAEALVVQTSSYMFPLYGSPMVSSLFQGVSPVG